jgi:hypothetical protein
MVWEGEVEKELLYITSLGHAWSWALVLPSTYARYVMAWGHLQCYRGQGLEPGARVGDEQVGPLRQLYTTGRPCLCYSTCNPPGVTTLWVMATKFSGVDQPLFAGFLLGSTS